MTSARKIKIGYSVDRKKFMVKLLPDKPIHSDMEKIIRSLGRSQIEKVEDKAYLWLIDVSMILAIKLSANVASMAKVQQYEVLVTATFEAKKDLLENHIKIGKNRLGKKSKHEIRLKKRAIPRKMDKVLMPFQKKGYDFIVQKNGRALIADEMGTGKTIQTLTFIKAYRSIKRIVVVCPKTIKHVWDAECTKWGINDARFIIDGAPGVYDLDYTLNKNQTKIVSGTGLRDTDIRITIINYAMVGKWLPILKHWNPDMIVCDEIHYIKNRKAARTAHVEALGDGCKFVVGLTGTPVANSPMELFTISNMIRPKMFDYTNFNYRFCGGEAMQCRSAYNSQELYEIMNNTIMLRRLKKDVMSELPPKRDIQVELEIDMNKYDTIIDAWAEELDAEAHAMTYKAKLRECLAHDKIPALLEWCDKFLEDTDRKLIIFAHHKVIINMLMKHYGDLAVKIDGGVNDTDRIEAVDRFQTDDSIRIFVGSITACAEGITLTAASDVVMSEMLFNPKKMEQAEDRAHRKGQNNHVTIWNLVCTGTFEVDILSILKDKRIMAAQVVDGKTAEVAELSVERECTYRLLDLVAERKFK